MNTPSLSYRRSIVNDGVWLLFSIFLYFYLQLFKNALIDDAFITLQYAKTLISSGTWGFFPGVIANSATSPLNVFLLTAMSLLTGPTVEAALWLYFACMLTIAGLLTRLSRQLTGSQIYGWLAVSAFTFNPLLVSTIGLESILLTTLFVLAIYCYHSQRWILLAIALGLLTLARADGILFFLVFFLFVPHNKIRLQLAVFYCLCLAPWYLFSWLYLGSFLPDTFFIKTQRRVWWESDFFNGIMTAYYYVYPLATLLSFAFLPLITLLLSRKIRQEIVLVIIGLAGLIHFIGYSTLGVPPFHWYYVPQVITLILFASLGLGVLYRNSSQGWQRGVLRFVIVICFFAPALGMLSILRESNFVVQEMPIHTNWATHAQYKEIGLWLKENHEADTIRLAAGEVGTLTYYCDCRLLDRFSDRSWLKEYIAERISHPGIVPMLLRVNFAFYAEPSYPPEDFVMRAFNGAPDVDVESLKEWQTSTRWVPHAFLTIRVSAYRLEVGSLFP